MPITGDYHYGFHCGTKQLKNILYYKIAQFVGNAVGIYTSGHTDTGSHRLSLQGVACGRGVPAPRRCGSRTAAIVNKGKTTPSEARCRLVMHYERCVLL